MAAYGVDTLDPAVSLRRVWVLLNRLPPQFRRGGEQWSAEADLLALLTDHVANLTWVTLRAHGAKNAKRPKPVPRPGDRHPRRQVQAPPARPELESGTKHNSWMAAVDQLRTIPGVVVDDG